MASLDQIACLVTTYSPMRKYANLADHNRPVFISGALWSQAIYPRYDKEW